MSLRFEYLPCMSSKLDTEDTIVSMTCSPTPFFRALGLVPLFACDFSQQNSTYLASSPTSYSLYYTFSFTFTASWIDSFRCYYRYLDSATYFLDSQAFLWDLGGSIHASITLALFMPAKLASHGQCQSLSPFQSVSVPHGYSHLWVPGQLNMEKHYPSVFFFLRERLSNEFTILQPRAWYGWGLANSWCPQSLFSVSQWKVIGLSLTTTLLSTHYFSVQTASFSDLSALLFTPDSHSKSG
jgi:hypothetical protein